MNAWDLLEQIIIDLDLFPVGGPNKVKNDNLKEGLYLYKFKIGKDEHIGESEFVVASHGVYTASGPANKIQNGNVIFPSKGMAVEGYGDMNANELAEYITANTKWKKNQTIRLVSCGLGERENDDNFAQILSDALKTDVIAAPTPIYFELPKIKYFSSKCCYKDWLTGREISENWRRFTPRAWREINVTVTFIPAKVEAPKPYRFIHKPVPPQLFFGP